MGKNKLLHITISKPCSENWEEMSVVKNGKFCAHCKKQVVDFTNFSDSDLHTFLQSNPVPCGRFYADQLERPIIPAQHQKTVWKKLLGLAAGLVTFFVSRNATSANTKAPVESHQQPHYLKGPQSKIPGDSVRIAGKVSDHNNNPLQYAIIEWDNEYMTQAGTDGRFEFTRKIDGKSKPHVITIRYANFTEVTKTYFPAMGNVDYTIRLSMPVPPRAILFGYMGPVYDIEKPKLKRFKTQQTAEPDCNN